VRKFPGWLIPPFTKRSREIPELDGLVGTASRQKLAILANGECDDGTDVTAEGVD
jgi:hypothetical protein